jgi:biopolymer transport protein ExbD
MIVTNIREEDPKMKLQLPDATEVQKLEQKNLILFIYVGLPDSLMMKKTGNHPLIQINNEFVSITDISSYIDKKRAGLSPEERGNLVASLKIDKDIRMGLVTDIKQILRESNVVTINYVAGKSKE